MVSIGTLELIVVDTCRRLWLWVASIRPQSTHYTEVQQQDCVLWRLRSSESIETGDTSLRFCRNVISFTEIREC